MYSPDDILRWPCGSWCYREELAEMTHLSDDFEVLPYDSTQWQAFALEEGLHDAAVLTSAIDPTP